MLLAGDYLGNYYKVMRNKYKSAGELQMKLLSLFISRIELSLKLERIKQLQLLTIDF